MTARPSPSLPHNTQQQQKPGPRGSCEHWRRTRNHCQPPPWPASWPNQASAGDSCPPTTGLCAGTSKPATSNEQAASVKDAAGPPSSGASPAQAAAGSTTTTTAPARAAAAAAASTARGRRTGPCTGRSPRHLHPPDSADQPQTRRSPAQRTRLHPRPDRRGLPRHQREDPPGPPLGPGGTQTPEKAETAHAPQPQANATPPGSVNIGVPLKTPVIISGGRTARCGYSGRPTAHPLMPPLDLPEPVRAVAVHHDVVITAAGPDIAVH